MGGGGRDVVDSEGGEVCACYLYGVCVPRVCEVFVFCGEGEVRGRAKMLGKVGFVLFCAAGLGGMICRILFMGDRRSLLGILVETY